MYYENIKLGEITKFLKNDGVEFIVVAKEQTKTEMKTGRLFF